MIRDKIILASNNPGKLNEFNQLFAQVNIGVIAQSEYGVEDAVEDGRSFVENAIIKARHAALLTGLPALADDSGLEVDFLNGAPGIHSARFAGKDASDADNNQKLLTLLKDVPRHQRSARFQCLLVLMRHADDPTPLICQGTWHGYIATQANGEHGFGYDPIFFVAEQNCNSAQLPREVKNQLSHRAQALRMLMANMAVQLSDTSVHNN